MSEIVFILGAGASKHAGAPLMADFLYRADELRKSGKAGKYISDFGRVFDAISLLQSVHSKAVLDLDNIESVFAVFEMGRLINRFPGISSSREIETLLVSIKRLILKTLEQEITYPIRNGNVYPPDSYNSFAQLVNYLNADGRRNRCSIITFNYDVALDSALHFNGHPADYCLSESAVPGCTLLVKLHGSLNWARCSKCREIAPWNLFDFFRSHKFITSLPGVESVHLDIGSRLSSPDFKHCQENVEPEPVIVPPTWNKTEYHRDLSKVWGCAASELSEAENIFVLGYSLPESDYFFRYLFALGSLGQKRIKRFWVFDPDGSVDSRFSNLLGQDTIKKFRYSKIRFEASIEPIRRELESIS